MLDALSGTSSERLLHLQIMLGAYKPSDSCDSYDGLLAGIGVLAIPGLGPLIAAGPIIAALSGGAIGAGVGGLTVLAATHVGQHCCHLPQMLYSPSSHQPV
jgi:hypothetical protein